MDFAHTGRASSSSTSTSYPALPNGPMIAQGPKGETGQAGQSGTPGTQGLIGLPGPAGPPGRPGAAGPAGAQGPAGPSGSPGVQGPVAAPCSICIPPRPDSDLPKDRAPQAIAGVSAIVTALIAGVFALLGLLIAKENKTSEFRQNWIDALRGDIAEYAAAVRALAHAESDDQIPIDRLEYNKLVYPIYSQAVNAQTRIRLRINPNDSKPKLRKYNLALLARVSAIQDAINSEENYPLAGTLASSLHEDAAPVLKLEWDRVKKGEPIYVLSRIGAIALIVVALIAALHFYRTVLLAN